MDSTKMASTTDSQLDSITVEGLRNRSGGREILGNQVKDEDTLALARSGKKQILAVKLHSNALSESILMREKRRFGFVSVVGFACTLMNTWEGVLT
jgi:hypothetical protein